MDDNVFFVFEFVYIVDYVDGFPYIEPSLHPCDEAYLIMMDDCFDVFLDLVCVSSLRASPFYLCSPIFLSLKRKKDLFIFIHMSTLSLSPDVPEKGIGPPYRWL